MVIWRILIQIDKKRGNHNSDLKKKKKKKINKKVILKSRFIKIMTKPNLILLKSIKMKFSFI